MSCGKPNNYNQSQQQGCCPPAPIQACCPPIFIKTKSQNQEGRTIVFQLPPVNIVCEIPPPPKNQNPPKVCYIPIVCCEEGSDIDPTQRGGCQPKRQHGGCGGF